MTALLNLAAILLGLAAFFGYLNHRWLKLPHTIGLVVIALAASLAILALDLAFPALGFRATVRGTVQSIDFPDVLMHGMLSFLLFAGALHVDLSELAQRKWAIGSMASIGVLISTLLVASAIYLVSGALDLGLPFTYCLVFGALISPTDPIAVLGILKTVDVPPSLEAKIAGESLFNDGVGIVVFTLLLAIAMGTEGGEPVTALMVAELFALEALGGAALGLAAGFIAYRAIGTIDEHNLEVLITLALVTLAYSVATMIHVSGPIAVVVAGLLIGNHGRAYAMSDRTRDHLFKFWSLTDEVLNSVLFLIIGFEVLALTIGADMILASLIAVPVVLAARFAAVSFPIAALSLRRDFTRGAIPVLTWGGLRGGISVALALSLPAFPQKDLVLAMTYGVVIFSIVVQGLTVEKVVRRAVG
ncbi:MAG TPA: sodium:proton antiporter [Alphaproteobacteria bacterium]|nr:sodium:proton antiporter [Alphaproteobacteria bacterium]